jgi:hypothetical protein
MDDVYGCGFAAGVWSFRRRCGGRRIFGIADAAKKNICHYLAADRAKLQA